MILYFSVQNQTEKTDRVWQIYHFEPIETGAEKQPGKTVIEYCDPDSQRSDVSQQLKTISAAGRQIELLFLDNSKEVVAAAAAEEIKLHDALATDS
jgi:hypothetical protein